MVRLFDDGLGGKYGVTNNKIRQIGVVQRHRPQEQRFFLGPEEEEEEEAAATPSSMYALK